MSGLSGEIRIVAIGLLEKNYLDCYLFLFSVKWFGEVILFILCMHRCKKVLLFPRSNEERKDKDSRHPCL